VATGDVVGSEKRNAAEENDNLRDDCYMCRSRELIATSVWTGSMNLTFNANQSLENAVHIRDPIIARGYVQEWAQILGISECLDWTSEWCAPEFHIGT
jgi:hypothetical protein